MRSQLGQTAYIDYFLHSSGEGRSLASLDANLTGALKLELDSRQLAIILYHSAFAAVNRNVYGDERRAKNLIASHVQTWADKAIHQKYPEPFAIPHMLNGFEILKMRPPERFLEYVATTGSKMMRRVSGQSMLDIFSATATLGLTHSDAFLQAMQKQILHVAPNMKGRDLYDLFHYMAIIDAVTVHSPKAPQFGWKKTFDQLFADQKVQRALAIDCEGERPRKLLDAYYWFHGEKLSSYPMGPESESMFEHQVKRQFKAAGATITRPVHVKQTGHKIDLAASFNGTSFVVECDGPTHFIYALDDNRVYLNGNTVFQSALIKKREPDKKLIRLPYVSFEANADSPHIWTGLLKQIEKVKPGGYLVNTHGTLSSLVTRCSLIGPPDANASSPSCMSAATPH